MRYISKSNFEEYSKQLMIQIKTLIIKIFSFSVMSNHFEKKTKSIIAKMWNQTQFSIWSNTAKRQANSIYQVISKYMEGFRDFQTKMDFNLSLVEEKKHTLPAFHVINQQLKACKIRVDKILQSQAQIIGKIIELLADYRKNLQFGEIKATKQYSFALTQSMTPNYHKLSQRKILEIHQSQVNLDFKQKNVIKDSVRIHPFEKWFADFSIRSEKFFMKIFSSLEIDGITFDDSIKSSKSLLPREVPHQPPVFNQQSSEMEQESDDIVKQIFREIENC